MGLDPRFPHELSHRDWTVLLCHPDGRIEGDDGCGLYHDDCRVISAWELKIDGRRPEWVSSGSPEPQLWAASLRVARPGGDEDGPRLPQDALEVRVRRAVGNGLRERIGILNHAMVPTEVALTLSVRMDFADVLEVGQSRRQQQGTISQAGNGRATEVRNEVTRGDRTDLRGLRVRVARGSGMRMERDGDGLRMEARVALPARGAWEAELAYQPLADGEWGEPGALRPDRELAAWRRNRPRVRTSRTTLDTAWATASDDLYALRNRDMERDAGVEDAWVVNAGVPIFTGLFGRDVLTAGWQGALIGPRLMRGALALIAKLQATSDDAWRDMEPGKLIHELRRGPLGRLGITAQGAGYYGTQTTSALFPLVLSELWHWTGDTDALRRYRGTAERALAWAREHGDLDGDGFLEYQQRSPVGIKNQAWKDSNEAIRYPDGSQVPNPIATVEEQAFHYLALVRMAEIFVVLEDDDAAESYVAQARVLRDRWHAAFWMADEGFYAMALDPDKRPVRSIGSNAVHALACGIVPAEHARRVAERLFAPDLFSGWGVRTLSTAHPSYNPWAYHLGTVWPVENATFLLGLKRYGFDDLVERLALALLDAAERLPGMRLPEAIGGQSRDELPIPVPYPQANSPQAWSASATVQLVQIMLGIYPFAPMRTLALVRPRLPTGVDALTLHNLVVGDARVSLRFERRSDGSTEHSVIHRRGVLLVANAPPPDAVQPAGVGETLAALALEKAPGRMARAARLAVGSID